MSGNEPNKLKRGEGWGDGEMGAQMGKYGRNKQKKREVTNFIEILGFPDSEMFLPRPALCDSVSFFEKKSFIYRARGNKRTF